MEVIVRGDEDNIFYEDGKEFTLTDLFIPTKKGEYKREYVSFDLTWVGSLVLQDLINDYEFAPTIKDIKTPYQWTVIESPTRLYMIGTLYSTWSCLTAKMGLDESQEPTFTSYKVKTVRELYEKSLNMGFNKLTIASSALDIFRKGLETGQFIINHQRYPCPKVTYDEWRGFSNVDIPYIDMMFRTMYRGAITWGRKGVYKNVVHIDRRSMYPSTASQNRMPFGIPSEFQKSETDLALLCPVGILHLREGKIPMIGFANPKLHRKHALTGRMGALLEDILLDGDMFFFDFEWELITEMYEFNGHIHRTLYVETVEPTHLKTYFETCYNLKQSLKKGTDEYNSVKKLLNALYGKLAVKILRESITYINHKRETIKKEIEDLSYYNILVGAHITARARCSLINMCKAVGLDNVLYMDTDSVFFKRDAFKDRDSMLKTCQIGKKMGDWDLEDENIELSIIGPKTYQLRTPRSEIVTGIKTYPQGVFTKSYLLPSSAITKCAGLPLSISKDVEWGKLYEGLELEVIKRKRDKKLILHEEKRKHKITSRPEIIKTR